MKICSLKLTLSIPWSSLQYLYNLRTFTLRAIKKPQRYSCGFALSYTDNTQLFNFLILPDS